MIKISHPKCERRGSLQGHLHKGMQGPKLTITEFLW